MDKHTEILAQMKQAYLDKLTAPADDFWIFGIIDKSDFYGIYIADEVIGYGAVSKDRLLSFYLIDHYRRQANEIFNHFIQVMHIKTAYSCTYDLDYFNLCLDVFNKYDIEGILYAHDVKLTIACPEANIEERLALLSDLHDAISYTAANMEGPSEWLEEYYRTLIDAKGLYLYVHEGRIVASGEMRYWPEIENAANIGMTVAVDYRKRGMGTYVLRRMADFALDKGLQPVCGTDLSNIASQKTISKAGFRPIHRIVDFKE